MEGFANWIQQLQFGNLIKMLIIAVSSLLCITVHETCHGLVAYWIGDSTAKRAGRLTLNPLHHIDIMGLIMMVIVGFGWAKPVPVNMNRFKKPRIGMAVTAFAGPASNFLLVLVSAFLNMISLYFYLQTGSELLYYLRVFLEYTMVLSAGLAVFNLFPVPPLDGSKVLFSLLPDSIYRKLMKYERYGIIILAILLFTNVLDVPLMYLRNGLIEFSQTIVFPAVEVVLQIMR